MRTIASQYSSVQLTNEKTGYHNVKRIQSLINIRFFIS
jgi:hypothetical protein